MPERAARTPAVGADLLDLLDYVYRRLAMRIDGLGDAEWAWTPTRDNRIGIRWRIQHMTEMLCMERSWTWFGLAAPHAADLPAATEPATAAEAIAALDASYRIWRGLVAAQSDAVLAEPIGELAGAHYAGATRRSFVLHVADELIHHGAEAALLRDLYRETR